VRNVDDRGLERLDDRLRTPDREPSGLARLLSCHDDELFRKKLMHILPGSLEALSKRQQKRIICKFRKVQHVWRFEDPGEFRNKVLYTMSEATWHAMYQDEQRGFLHMFHYAGGTPVASGQMYNRDFGSVPRELADESVSLEPPRAAGILRSRTSRQRSASPKRSRGSHHRRVRGLSSEEL
jgi:hypothetical protein